MVISLKNVTKIFGKNRVLDDVSVRFPTRSLSVVVGTHESGKRTLLRLLAGELKPDYGRVIERRRTSKAFAYENNDFFAGLKIADYCTLWSLLYRNFDMQKFRELLAEAGIAENNKFPAFSEEKKTWFKISLVVASNADVMIFDEPLLRLDQDKKIRLVEILEEAAKNGRTVVVRSQEIGEFENSALILRNQAIKAWHDVLTTRRGSMLTDCLGFSSSEVCVTSSNAALAISSLGCSTVEIPILGRPVKDMLSKPRREMSSGILTPFSSAACMAPKASASVAQKMAVQPSGELK